MVRKAQCSQGNAHSALKDAERARGQRSSRVRSHRLGKRKPDEGVIASPALLSTSALADSRWHGHHLGLAALVQGRRRDTHSLVDSCNGGGIIRQCTWNSGIRSKALSLLRAGCWNPTNQFMLGLWEVWWED